MSEDADAPQVVYHVPYPLDRSATSASGIRPVRMREAFDALGARVWEVSGDPGARRAARGRILRHLRAGGHLDLAYSESATLPTLLTGEHHLPTHPLLDLGLLRGLARRGVPVGLFYRDVYWRDPEYRHRVGPLLASATIPLYRLDLWAYRHSLTRLYLPSLGMAEHVPGIPREMCAALPPGCEVVARDHRGRRGSLALFYVGGLNDHYRLHSVVRAVARTRGVAMVLCTRADGWNERRGEYEPLLGGHTSVVHASGGDLEGYYRDADVAVLAVEPQPYREFAVPFKLFEYIGHGIPVIATRGTLAGEMVESLDIGWTVPHDVSAMGALLARLREDPGEVEAAARRVRAVAPAHTWEARARHVLEDLTGS